MSWLIAKWKAICFECGCEIREGDEFLYTRNNKYCETCGEEVEPK